MGLQGLLSEACFAPKHLGNSTALTAAPTRVGPSKRSVAMLANGGPDITEVGTVPSARAVRRISCGTLLRALRAGCRAPCWTGASSYVGS